MNLEITLCSGILNLSVFHHSKFWDGEFRSGILSTSPNPHQVAREIHRKYSAHSVKSITLSAPQSRLDLPKKCRNNFYGVYPDLLCREVQEHLSTLFTHEVRINYAEC